jgi:hypothetical protein
LTQETKQKPKSRKMKTIQVTYREMILVENVKTMEVSDELYKKIQEKGSGEWNNLYDEISGDTEIYEHFDSKDTQLEIEVIG